MITLRNPGHLEIELITTMLCLSIISLVTAFMLTIGCSRYEGHNGESFFYKDYNEWSKYYRAENGQINKNTDLFNVKFCTTNNWFFEKGNFIVCRTREGVAIGIQEMATAMKRYDQEHGRPLGSINQILKNI